MGKSRHPSKNANIFRPAAFFADEFCSYSLSRSLFANCWMKNVFLSAGERISSDPFCPGKIWVQRTEEMCPFAKISAAKHLALVNLHRDLFHIPAQSSVYVVSFCQTKHRVAGCHKRIAPKNVQNCLNGLNGNIANNEPSTAVL